ncbi:MAG: hypothetical protein ABW185_04425 [Sedimenticola sp.]
MSSYPYTLEEWIWGGKYEERALMSLWMPSVPPQLMWLSGLWLQGQRGQNAPCILTRIENMGWGEVTILPTVLPDIAN